MKKNISIRIIIGILLLLLLSNIQTGIKIKNMKDLNQLDDEEHPWPMFRHDLKHSARTKYTGPPAPNLSWKYKTDDEIVSSAAIHKDGTIYVGAGFNNSNLNDPNLYAFNPDGKIKWKFDGEQGFFSSPAIGPNNTIYCIGNNDDLYSIEDKGTHAILNWKINLGFFFGLCSPTVGNDGTIHTGSPSFYYSQINPDGTIKWRYKTNWCIISSPAINNGIVYIGSKDHHLYAFDENDQELKWKFATGEFYDGHLVDSSPAIGEDGTIYFGTDPYGAWEQDPILVKTNFWAVNPNGTLKWIFETDDGVESSPAIGFDGTIYFGSYDGYLYSLTDNGNKGTLNWKFKTDGPIDGSPIVDGDGVIYFASRDSYLYALYPNGNLKWKFKAEDGFESSPSLDSKGYLYIGSFDNYFYCIGTGGPDVGVEKIDIPANLPAETSINPKTTIRNYRKDTQIFDVKCEIKQNGEIIYSDTKNIIINGGSKKEQVFSPFETDIKIGTIYNIKITTIHPEDENKDNDQKNKETIITDNKPPEKPNIVGTIIGKIGKEYKYKISSFDPNRDDVYYQILWHEDYLNVSWDGPYKSGEEIIKKFSYQKEGEYVLKVKAKDIYDAESEWAELKLVMPRERYNHIFIRIIKLFSNIF